MDGKLADTDDIALRGYRYTRDQFSDIVGQTEEYVREKPAQAMLWAFGIGFVFNKLPVGRLISVFGHLVMFALKPAMLVYGAMKLYQAAQDE
jgi:hypothetical protein